MNWMIEDYEFEARMKDDWQREYALWREDMYRDVPPPTPEKEE